ncbi:MAG TPA: DUF92 domain-containing protein [Bryobacteraceae bacterium]|nr:DUF92 domain-containing protein [Bryobacteraceae bacterium]
MNLDWQSKCVLLAVLPFVAADVVLQTHTWATQAPNVVIWTLGLSSVLGLVTWKLRAATPAAAATGSAITANLMFSTIFFPYDPMHSALIPVLAVSLLAFTATRIGRHEKERLGTAEKRHGRTASQVAANLGFAALASSEFAQSWFAQHHWLTHTPSVPMPLFAVALAAMAEAAADTVSSEVGQVIGGRPRMITSLRVVEPGRNGAVTLSGTLAGALAGAAVAAAGTQSVRGDLAMFWIATGSAVFGLFFDSLLGATFEEGGLLNNDAVNFLSTVSAAAFALALMTAYPGK